MRPVSRQACIDWSSIEVGTGTVLIDPSNIYGCQIGKDCRVGPFVEIQQDVKIGNLVKIASHSFICAGCVIDDSVFIGHGVMFCNDKWPWATVIDENGKLKLTGPEDWKNEPIHIGIGASIGSGVTLLPGIVIGRGALVGGGSVVTRSVEPGEVVYGNPARTKREHVQAGQTSTLSGEER